MSIVFTPFKIKNLIIKNRIVRAATYEGMADENGIPSFNELLPLYSKLAQNKVGMIITGFNFTSQQGRAMQTKQCGLDNDEKLYAWKKIIDEFKSTQNGNDISCKLFVQISHTGRQTNHLITGHQVVAPSTIKCSYFREKPRPLTETEIFSIVEEYAMVAKNAQKAGFDGVQIHCAHGYLIHQFLSPHTNRRNDQYGGSVENRFRFLRMILEKTKMVCGKDYPIICKISLGDDRSLTLSLVKEYVTMMISSGCVAAIEFSYGTMEYAMNIFRGNVPIDIVLKHNILFKNLPKWVKDIWKFLIYPISFKRKFKPFTANYNLQSALQIMNNLNYEIPFILTGGIRNLPDMEEIISKGITAISLSRPLICENDFVLKISDGLSENKNKSNNKNKSEYYKSKCINCNLCTVMCDSGRATRCYNLR